MIWKMLEEPPLVVDTDFLSSFAWVKRLDIIETLFPKQMVLLEEVKVELSRVPHLSIQIDDCITRNTMSLTYMTADSPEAIELVKYLDSGKYGPGESACMAYLRYNPGTMGSNNTIDVIDYCRDNNKKLICTGHCLCFALDSGIVKFEECESLWAQMISKRRFLPTKTFGEFNSKHTR